MTRGEALVVLRKCPSCGGALRGFAGVRWMSCAECPAAWDPFAAPAASLPTWRAGGTGDVVLPFFLFEAGDELIWVPAYRAAGTRSDSDIGALLGAKRHRPELTPAPLGASLGRGLAEATALAELRRPPEVALVCKGLVALPCRERSGLVEEPVTGIVMGRGQIVPC